MRPYELRDPGGLLQHKIIKVATTAITAVTTKMATSPGIIGGLSIEERKKGVQFC